ncbi:hypothetical protein C2S53_014331 [Perilla frutescens var. hirtella]|uniref:Calmodulin-binding protein n=1 Tax=Perilla frutescens var. hirtella TaxID=608512 RepID=A0AAD4J3K3_PERFH|nr:hypothetical protein C2S53_014331 [Perilla frutescens var. hirtella]
MVLKRQLRQGEEGGSELPNKRQHFASNLLKGLNHGRFVQESMSCLEPIIRKMVKESVEQTINRVMRSSDNQVECPASRSLQLRFHSNLPETLFTGNMLRSEDRSPIKLVLFDSVSKQIMTCGPLSSLKVAIVVLDGDFGSDDQEDWTTQEFEGKLVKNRDGKRPLVAGEVTVTLKDGVGSIGDLCFTDNSKWSRSGKFRLGAKAQSGSVDMSIREAVSNAFRVKDHRGESYQKHHPPALEDEVWRLERIAKDGTSHKKLNDSGIFTVGEFLRRCARDQSRLREIIQVSKRAWDTIIGHAKTCILGEEKFMYRTARGILLFDSVDKVVAVSFDGETYYPANTLNSFQMRLVEDLKQEAYSHQSSEWIPFSDPPVAAFPMLLGNATADSFTNPNLGLIGINFHEQDQHGLEMNGVRSTMLPSYTTEMEQENCSFQLGESSDCAAQVFNPTFRNSFAISDPLTGFCSGGHQHHIWGSESNYDLPMDGTFQVESSPWQGNGLFLDPGNHGIGIISSDSGLLIPRTGSPKTKWCKVLAVVKWRILVRRNVAARKCKNFYSYV